jgi:DNA-binding CsgD family transcriptional regulator
VKPLTKREYEVMTLRAKGLTYKEVAYELGISLSTIKRRMSAASDKAGGGGTLEVYRALGWLRVPGESTRNRWHPSSWWAGFVHRAPLTRKAHR